MPLLTSEHLGTVRGKLCWLSLPARVGWLVVDSVLTAPMIYDRHRLKDRFLNTQIKS